jgi:CheY-like chemotaxis protein
MPCSEEVTNNLEPNVHLINSTVESNAVKVKENELSGTILLAEDHQDNCKLISRILTSLGLTVFTAKNGKEAVEQFLKHKPNVILLDIQMPEMDGIEAHSIMRQKGATQPIIALTANAMSHEVEEYLAQGFDDHLKKPIERQAFIKTISQYYRDDFCSDKAEDSLNKVDMSDLIEQFKSNLVLEQQDIVLHIKNEDFEKLAQLVHRLAGAAQMFGFDALTGHAIKLEKVIKNNKFNQVSINSQALLNEIDKILW